MTTTTDIQGHCQPDRCEAHIFIDRGHGDVRDEPCGMLVEHHKDGDDHVFKAHTHTPACDAEFWALMGCDPRLLENGRLRCQRIFGSSDDDWDHMDARHPHADVALAPILSAPETAESWLAMRDLLMEIERRGWKVEFYNTDERPYLGIWDFNVPEGDLKPNLALVGLNSLAAAPRAVAEAVKAAVEGAGE